MTPISSADFADFKAASLAQGFDEVLERSWGPDLVLESHSHPFAVRACVVQAETPNGLVSGRAIVGCGESRAIIITRMTTTRPIPSSRQRASRCDRSPSR